ncbi:MAG: VWA domain-containing protein [Limisphaerales bacterium]
MTWAHPEVLWLLAGAAPLLALLAAWSWRRRRELVARFVPVRLQQRLAPGISRGRYAARAGLWLAGLACLLLALARPRLGVTDVEMNQRGLDVLVAIDVSRSMLAEDGGAGVSRLARARLAAMDLVRLGGGDRFGLIAFAGTAFLQTPLTFDDEAFRQSLEALAPDLLPQGGTALGPAIRTALSAADSKEGNVSALVIFTDGENHESGVDEAAAAAAQAGLRIFTVGVGSPRGEVIQLRDAEGRVTYLKDATGQVVKSALNETMLKQIAEQTRGFYLPLQGPNPMATLYERGLAPLPRLDAGRRTFRQFHERFQWPLAAALALLALESLLPDQRRRRGKLRAAAREHPTLRGVAAGAAGLLLLAAAAPRTEASAAAALRDYQRGQFGQAQAEYERLAARDTNDLRLRFNAGAAAFKARDLDNAEGGFRAATQAADIGLQKDAWRNLGDTAYFRGDAAPDPELKRQSWQEALRRYETALKINPADPAARNNREFVRRALEELPPPPKQQQQQKPQQQDPKSKQQEDPQPDQQSGKDNQPQDQEQSQGDQEQPPEEKPGQQPKSPDSGQRQDGRDQPDNPDQSRGQDSPQAEDGKQGREARGDQGESGQDAAASGADGTPREAGDLTRAEAQRLLDSARGEEKILPLEKPRARSRTLKDW